MRVFVRRCSSKSRHFAEICHQRKTERSFDIGKPLSDELIKTLLELTQTSPSSFNLQPYKIILVRTEELRQNLSKVMLGKGNIDRVLEAPLTVVFAADKEPTKLTKRLMELELKHGADPTYVSTLPQKISFLFGKGLLSQSFRTAVTHLISPLSATPVIADSTETWAVKNTCLAAQTFMLAATAHDVSTSPMEGFDERRLCFELKIPAERYSIPMIISCGYPKASTSSTSSASTSTTLKARYALSDVVFDGTYNHSFSS